MYNIVGPFIGRGLGSIVRPPWVGGYTERTGMPQLNTSHPLYDNIVNFLEGVGGDSNRFDDVLNQVTNVVPGFQHVDQKVITTAIGSNAQGIATDGEYWYVFNTTSLKKYNSSWTEVASNTNPWTDVNQNHIGDGFYYNGHIYASVGKSGVTTYNRVVKYSTTDLSYVSDNTPSFMGNMGVSKKGKVRYGIGYYTTGIGATVIKRFQLSDETPLSDINLSTDVRRAQGIAEDDDGNFWITSYNYDDPSGSSFNEVHKFSPDGTFLVKFVPWLWADGTGVELEGIEYYNGELFANSLEDGIIRLDVYDSSIRMNNNAYLGNGDGITLVSDDPTFPETGSIVLMMNSWDGGGTSPQQIFSADTTIDTSRKWGLQVQDPEAAAYRVYSTGYHYEANITGSVAIDHIYVCTWEKNGVTVDTTFYIDGVAIDGTINSTWIAPDSGGIILGNRDAEESNYRFGVKRVVVLNKVISNTEVTALQADFDAVLDVKTLSTTRPTGTRDRIFCRSPDAIGLLDSGQETERDKTSVAVTTDRTVEVYAFPGPGHVFVEWAGDISGSVNPYSVIMDGNKNISAVFDDI